MSYSHIRGLIKRLVKTGELKETPLKDGIKLTVVNFDKYQAEAKPRPSKKLKAYSYDDMMLVEDAKTGEKRWIPKNDGGGFIPVP